MKLSIQQLISNIALGKVLLKYQTIEEIPCTRSWIRDARYRISGIVYFHDDAIQFTDAEGQLLRAIQYADLLAVESRKGLLIRRIRPVFGRYHSLEVTFTLKDQTTYQANIITELFLTKEDLKFEKSPAPSLEKTLSTIYDRYKKTDHQRPDFPEYQ